jgi:hypothetical protein
MSDVMVCKLQLHTVNPSRSSSGDPAGGYVKFGAVWEGSSEKQALSENAIFGHYTPCAEFNASILNQAVVDKLVVGKKYYVTFTEAPD